MPYPLGGFLVSSETMFQLLRREATVSVESNALRSIYHFICGCVAKRDVAAHVCRIESCLKHSAGFAAICHLDR